MENGVVKTYFNGAITQNQLITIIVAIIAVLAILALAKKILKLVFSVAIIVVALVYFGVMSPEQLKDVSNVVEKQGVSVFTQIADTSKNVKVDKSNGVDVQVYIGDKWVSVESISSFVKSSKGYTVTINNKDYAVTDKGVQQVLDILEK